MLLSAVPANVQDGRQLCVQLHFDLVVCDSFSDGRTLSSIAVVAIDSH